MSHYTVLSGRRVGKTFAICQVALMGVNLLNQEVCILCYNKDSKQRILNMLKELRQYNLKHFSTDLPELPEVLTIEEFKKRGK